MTSESKPTTMGCRAIHDMMISRSTRRISQLPAEALTHESCYYDVLSAVNSVPGLHMCFEAWSKTVGPRTSQTGSRLESLKQLSQIQRQRYAVTQDDLCSSGFQLGSGSGSLHLSRKYWHTHNRYSRNSQELTKTNHILCIAPRG